MRFPDSPCPPLRLWIFLLLPLVLVAGFFIIPARFLHWPVLVAVAFAFVEPVRGLIEKGASKPAVSELSSSRRFKDSKYFRSLLSLPLAVMVGAFGIFADFSTVFDSSDSAKSRAGFEKSLENSAATTNLKLSSLGKGIRHLENGQAAGDPTDSDPRAQIVKLTGSWSEKGFHDAIEEPGDDEVVKLYLQTGMQPTTLINGASAILYGFQDGLGDDPLALLKIFQASGFKLDDDLTDGLILQSIAPDPGLYPFQGPLAPKNYTGGYFVSDSEPTGVFAGPLMLWIVEKDMMTTGPTDQDNEVLKYLISQGADCSVSLAFLDYNRGALDGTSNFTSLYPTIKACAPGA